MSSESNMTVAEHLSKVGVDMYGDSCSKVPGCCLRWPPGWGSPIDRAGKHERALDYTGRGSLLPSVGNWPGRSASPSEWFC
jgi:hypothetical protein